MLDDELKTLIDDAAVVSFDIFDTLLLRRHYAPTDVFAHARPKSRWFRRIRVAAEILTRYRHRPQQDVTLAQIYTLLRISPEGELQAEAQTLFANPSVREIYEYALTKGKPVIAVSDMYLPEHFLRQALERAGYTEIQKVYVSNEVGVTKHTGDLFPRVAKDLNLALSSILHVGDNEHSDVLRARERGVGAWHTPSPRTRFEAANPVHPAIVQYLRRAKHRDHSLLLGILRDGLADRSSPDDYWYRLGFSVAGPTINAFVDWIHERYDRENCSRVFLFARDGHLPQQILAIRHPQIPTHYTFASRRLFLVPALQELNKQNLSALRASLPGTLAHEYWTRLGISNPAVEELLRSRFSPDQQIWTSADRKQLETFFREAHPLMLHDIQGERKVLRDYLSSIGMLDTAAKPLIVDIGWRATSQRFLEMAVPELEGTSGAYFGLSDDAYRNGRMKGWFFDGYTPLRARWIATACVEIMELLFSAPHPSMLKIEARPDGTFAPIFESDHLAEQSRSELVRHIHQGALDFTRRLLEHESAGYAIRLTRADIAEIIRAIVLNPSTEDVRHLGALPHAVGAGAARVETLIPDPAPDPRALFIQNLGKMPARLHWPGGYVRAAGIEHGLARELASRIAVTMARLALVVRERLTALLGK